MSRKVFLSFLGANNYKECVYTTEGKESRVVKYVQNAVIDLLASDFDVYYIFCTEKAYDTHFASLQAESNKKLDVVQIPEGFSESEIWTIFSSVFDKLEVGDEILYDITHSFRSLPMLGITLLQYAKFLKDIRVRGIYYGVFETLGPSYDIDNRFPDPKDRKVPLLNLTAFSLIQDWTIAANNFIKFGNALLMRELTKEKLTPILASSQGTNKEAVLLQKLATRLQDFSEELRTNRGKMLTEAYSAVNAKEIIDQIASFTLLPPFEPIISYVKATIEPFEANSLNNILLAAQWCIDKELPQQGFTQLQEGIITILCDKISLNYTKEINRNFVSSYLSVRFSKPEEEWRGELSNDTYKPYLHLLDQINNIRELVAIYDLISKKRNDINHGGFTESAKHSSFMNDLKKYFHEFKQILNLEY